MSRLSLSKLLIAVNVGLVLLVVIWLVGAASKQLNRLGNQQALAHITFAGTTAVQAVNRLSDEVLTAARLLAERPTLARLVDQSDTVALAQYLDRFRGTSQLSSCAVIFAGKVVADSGLAPALESPIPSPPATCDVALRRLRPGDPLVLQAVCPMTTLYHASVVAALALDRKAAERIGREIGLPVVLLGRDEALQDEENPRYDLRARALAAESPGARRINSAQVYVSVFPLRGATGEILGLVETEMKTRETVESLRGLVGSLVALSLLLIAVLAALSILVARWLARPLESLTRASVRIGAGDLTTPIPHASGAEIGSLATSMEEMRVRLLHLTAALRHRQVEAEAVLTGIAEGVYAVDRERRFRYLNPQAAALLDVSQDQVLGRFCGDVLNPRGPGDVRPCETNCPIVHARFGGQARATEHLLLPGGRRRIVVITSASSAPLKEGDSGEAPGLGRQFQIIRDETEAEASRRLRDVVFANISHEFKTPLAAQLASIELLRERLVGLDAPEAEMLVLSLQRGTLRLTQLIDNLLESVRLESGQRAIRRRPVNLDEVIEEASELTGPLIAHRTQTLSVDLPYPIPSLTGDATRLTQVFVNLLANASKFAPEGSSIRIGGSVSDSEVSVWVEDEGPGLRASALATVFERFVRAPGSDEEEEPEQSGMGLGLSIVKSIVDRHGGRVEVRGGKAPGQGTRMWVTLPRETGHENPGR